MNRLITRLSTISILAALSFSAPSTAQDAVKTLEELLNEVRTQGQQITSENQAREREFRQNRDQQKSMLVLK